MAWKPLQRAALLLFAGALFVVSPGTAQTLARPGWAGSGLNGEPWWRSAVFYRVDPRTFQDSDGDGVGDLPGLTSRLDYLQTLGVDALILEAGQGSPNASRDNASAPPSTPLSLSGASHPTPSGTTDQPFQVIEDPGFEELVSEASRRHLRVVIAQPLSADTAILLARARLALTRGAAGIELTPFPSTGSGAPVPTASYVLGELRTLAASFPGERIILSDLPVAATSLTAARPSRFSGSLHLRGWEAPELTAFSVPMQPTANSEAAASLRVLVNAADTLAPGIAPLYQADRATAASPGASLRLLPSSSAAFLAARLLTLRGALTLDAGEELGLPSTASGSSAARPLMQWTPRNITPPAVKIEPNPDPAPPTRSDVYGPFRPYVPVKPKPVTLPGAPQPPPDPNSLPGFTSGELPLQPPPAWDTARQNVAVEDLDPQSLLNLYRRLIVLHHGHATLRTGSTAVLELSSPGATVWVRRAPTGARTVASVIVACNLSDAPLTLSIDSDLERAHIRGGLLRPLLGTAVFTNGPQSTAHLSLPAHTLYIGEIYHH